MKPIIVVIKETDYDGNLVLAKKELTDIINEAYDTGYAEGKKDGTLIAPPYTAPYSPTTPWTIPYYDTQPYCNVSSDDDSVLGTVTKSNTKEGFKK